MSQATGGQASHEALEKLAGGRVLLEIRSYLLVPGSRDSFHDLVATQSVPLLRAAGTDVIAFGPSLHDDNSYFLMRAYLDIDDLRRSQESFYQSEAWRSGPRQAIVDSIIQDTNAMMWVFKDAAKALRQAPPAGGV